MSVDDLVEIIKEKGYKRLESDIVFHRLVNNETHIEKCIVTGLIGQKNGNHTDKVITTIQIWTEDSIFINSLPYTNWKNGKPHTDYRLLEFRRPEKMLGIIDYETREEIKL